MDWRKAVVHTTGTVDEELLLRREYLSTENRILVQQLQGRLRLTDPQSQTQGWYLVGYGGSKSGGVRLEISSDGYFDHTGCNKETSVI